MHPMAITRVDMMPRHNVRAMLKQARLALPASPLHSWAPLESGAQHPTKQEVHHVHLCTWNESKAEKKEPSIRVIDPSHARGTQNQHVSFLPHSSKYCVSDNTTIVRTHTQCAHAHAQAHTQQAHAILTWHTCNTVA